MGNRLGILLHRLTNVAHNMGSCCSFRKVMIRYEIGYSCFHSHPEWSSFEVGKGEPCPRLNRRATFLESPVFGRFEIEVSQNAVFGERSAEGKELDWTSMNKVLIATLLLAAAVLFSPSIFSQTITLKAVNGKNGKPLPKQRLLVFAGSTSDEVRIHKYSYDLTTNNAGIAILVLDRANINRIQVWADFKTLCQSTPNLRSYGVSEIITTGVSTPNDCASFSDNAVPGQLVIFARPRTLREISEE
jgi:hypothetical protein